MIDYDYHQEATRRAEEAEQVRTWAQANAAIRTHRDKQIAEIDRLAKAIRVMIVIVLITIIGALCAPLVGCGGGECDQSCRDTLDQANGKMSIQPPTCGSGCQG